MYKLKGMSSDEAMLRSKEIIKLFLHYSQSVKRENFEFHNNLVEGFTIDMMICLDLNILPSYVNILGSGTRNLKPL